MGTKGLKDLRERLIKTSTFIDFCLNGENVYRASKYVWMELCGESLGFMVKASQYLLVEIRYCSVEN